MGFASVQPILRAAMAVGGSLRVYRSTITDSWIGFAQSKSKWPGRHPAIASLTV
jgi:hypothetical protein